VHKKVFIALVILLMLIIAKCNVPVYAEDDEVYILEPGKVYRFKNSENVRAVFSDYVLCGATISGNEYYKATYYRYWDSVKVSSLGILFVYNCNNKPVTMTVVEKKGRISEVQVYEPSLSLVMYDGRETEFKVTNNNEGSIEYRNFEYNEISDSLDNPDWSDWLYTSLTLTGRGVLLFPYNINDLEDNITIEGDYEVSEYVRLGFFQGPPWILKTDLTGMIQALLDQLSMLLPVGLVILSAFLLISLIMYIVRLFR